MRKLKKIMENRQPDQLLKRAGDIWQYIPATRYYIAIHKIVVFL